LFKGGVGVYQANATIPSSPATLKAYSAEFTGDYTSTSTTLSVTKITRGALSIGDKIESGLTVADTYIVSQLSSEVKYIGTWYAGTATLHVITVESGEIYVGQIVSGSNIDEHTTITAQVGGKSGQEGTYLLSHRQSRSGKKVALLSYGGIGTYALSSYQGAPDASNVNIITYGAEVVVSWSYNGGSLTSGSTTVLVSEVMFGVMKIGQYFKSSSGHTSFVIGMGTGVGNIGKYILILIHTYTYSYSYILILIHTHTHTCSYILIHTHIYSYILIHTQEHTQCHH
tara:strand:+ start:865 stop:1719 length:855 start_codon:yes stop_codon:yes gene_type:complete